jgi:NAD(P)-dependent dehydrogenase (short-subunit alcohol dehydrogenase family)
MDLDLSGKTAVVTGGSKGVGLAATRALLADGVRVVTGSRTITAELKETDAIPVIVDLSTQDGSTELIERAAALNALTEVIAEQYGPQGVRAVTVSPGPVSTGVWTDPDGFIALPAKRQSLTHDAFAEQLTSALGPSTGRISTPEEVARLIVFAASPNNLTGAELLVDGGVVKHI